MITYPFASASKSFVHAGWFTKYPPDFLSGISLLFSLFSARFSTDFSVELGKFSAPLEFETKAATKSKMDFTNMVPKILENWSEISYNMTKTYFFLFDFCDKLLFESFFVLVCKTCKQSFDISWFKFRPGLLLRKLLDLPSKIQKWYNSDFIIFAFLLTFNINLGLDLIKDWLETFNEWC